MVPETPIPEAYWVIPGRFLAGPYPGSTDVRIRHFLNAGIRVFLDLTEEGERPPYTPFLEDGVHHIRLPIPDFGIASTMQMSHTLDAIDWAVGTRRPIYVHCLGGLGRTGTVVGCFIVRHVGDGVEALRRIQVLRHKTTYADSPSPETDAQRRMVMTWRELERDRRDDGRPIGDHWHTGGLSP
jgi:hypothetical protein